MMCTVLNIVSICNATLHSTNTIKNALTNVLVLLISLAKVMVWLVRSCIVLNIERAAVCINETLLSTYSLCTGANVLGVGRSLVTCKYDCCDVSVICTINY